MDPIQEYFPSFPTGKKELFFGAGCLLGGLFLANTLFFGGMNLGFSIAVCVLVLLSCGYLTAAGCKPSAYSLSLLVLSVVIAASFARSDDGFVKFVMACFLLVSINLGLCLQSGKNRRMPGGVSSLADAFTALFSLGLGGMPPAIRGLRSSFRESGSIGRKSSAVLLGLGIALPVLLVIIPLLMQADAAFEGLLQKLPDFSFREFLLTVIFGSVFACVLYARGAALRHQASRPAAAKAAKGLPTATVNTVLGAVVFVYCVYLLSQLSYFAGSFSGLLPEEYTLAQYARRGFFEMAWLCVINLGIIVCGLWLCVKKDPAPLSTRILCLFIGIVTLFLVATASAKMLMYIGSYGLTRLRVLTQVVMIFLAFTVVFVCIWLFARRFAYMKAVILCALIIGAAVSWADVDTQVACYNTNAYLSGRTQSIDVDYLGQLGYGAVPYLAQLSREAPDAAVAQAAQNTLAHRWYRAAEDFRSWNYTYAVASEYLENGDRATETAQQ